MNNIVRPGVLIGVLCGLWTFVVGFTGWYKDPVMLNMFWVVIPIQIILLVKGLKKTAADGKTYGGQVIAGTMMSVVGGTILILSSLLFTTVVFPSYFEELRQLGEQIMRSEGKSEEEIRNTLEVMAATQTPAMQAIFGFIGTVVTGLVSSLIIGVFVKKKEQSA